MKDEIAEIAERAFEMASLVASNPTMRTVLGREAAQLGQQLTAMLTEIESLENSEYTKRCFQISEAMQDLLFVEKESSRVSNRLARELSRPRDF